MSVHPLDAAGVLTLSGRTLSGSVPGPSSAGAWQLNGPNTADLTSVTLGNDTEAFATAVSLETVDITGGLVFTGTMVTTGQGARGLFVLHPDYAGPTWKGSSQSNTWDNRQAGWRYIAGAGIWDSTYYGESGMDNYLSGTVAGSTLISGRPSAFDYLAPGNEANEAGVEVELELTPLGNSRYTLSWRVGGIERITSEVGLPDAVYVGVGHAGLPGYPTRTLLRASSVTAGRRTSLRSTAPSLELTATCGATGIELTALSPAVTFPVPLRLTAPGEQVLVATTSSLGGVQLAASLAGSYELDNPVFSPQDYSERTLRALVGRRVIVPTPAISRGRPFLPDHWIRPDSSFSVTSTGWSVVPDPPPPVYVPPDEGGPGSVAHRWVASGAQVAERDWIENWPSVAGGPAWKSLFPYRPRKRPWTVQGRGGRRHTYPAAVIHDPNYVEHLWMDLGAELAQPYSWIFVTAITAWPMPVQSLLGCGNALPASTISQVRKDRTFGEGGPDVRMFADRGALSVRTSGTNGVRARSHGHPRPSIFFGVFNGANSYAGVRDPYLTSVVKGSAAAAGNPRHVLTGRQKGWISDQHALKAVTLEIRLFTNRALTPAEMEGQYSQLATAYNFSIL